MRGRATRLALLVALTACQSGTPVETPTPTSIELSGTSFEMAFLGQTAPVGVTVRDQNGESLSGQTITWSVDDTGVATVDGNGVLTATGNGSATLSVSSSGLQATASVTVAQIATNVAIVSGLGQEAKIDSTLATPIVAEARDAGGAEWLGRRSSSPPIRLTAR